MVVSTIVQRWEAFLIPIGIIWVFIVVIGIIRKLFRAIRVFWLAKIFPTNLKKYGDWAVVTGGSSGIGRCYAREIARRGVNVVIISNELDALKLTTAEIRAEFAVECQYIHADFTEGMEAYDKVERHLVDKDVGILLNGAGIVGKAPCYYLDESDTNILTMIDLHIVSVLVMTKKLLPCMLKKQKGMVINISSLASFRPSPLWSVYSACKVFSNSLTRALCWEYSDKGIEFQLITPSFVKTRMTKDFAFIRHDALFPTVERFVQSAVETIGKTEHTTGYWTHELAYFFLEYVSDKPSRQYVKPSILKLIRKHD